MVRTAYDDFREAINNLSNEEVKHDCELLIYLASIYYSHYSQFKKLEKVKRKLLNIYQIEKDNITLKKGELSIIERLYLEFYLKLSKKKYGSKMDVNSKYFKNLIRDYKIEVHEIIEECELEERMAQKLEDNLMKVCRRVNKINKKNLNLGLKNIREAVDIFQENRNIKILSEEECFNHVFSETFIHVLIHVMKDNEIICHLYIAPVRAQLCKQEQGGRTIDSSATKWCYKQDFRYTVTELETEIARCQKIFGERMDKFIRLEKILNTILNE